MKVKFTPFVRGLDRSIDDSAQSGNSVRDVLNLLPNVTGRLDGMYRNPATVVPSTNSPTRWVQWDTYTVIGKTNPSGNVQVTNGTTTNTGPSGESKPRPYRTVCMMTGSSGAYAMADKADPFTKRCYVVKDSGTDWGDAVLSGSGTITVTFGGTSSIYPQRVGSTDPLYVVFDADSNEGSTTARIRTCTNPTYSGSDLQTVDYVGDTVAGVTRAYIIWDDDGVWQPSSFATWRNRLCASDANEVYFAGFKGNASPFVEPDQNDWAVFYELNSVIVGHSGQGNIVRMEPLGDQLIVFLENAIYRLYGYPPIAGTDGNLVVEEINPTLGISSYDAVGVAPDGNALFIAGNDGQAYIYNGQFILISEPTRMHPQFVSIDTVNVSEQYAIFTGTTVDNSRVPFETKPTDGGFTYQCTPAFLYHVDKGIWTMADQYVTDTKYRLMPVSDPKNIGIFGSFKVNGYYEICLSEPDGLHIVNDRTLKNPQLQDWLISGLATPQIPVSPQFRADSVTAIIENVYTPKLTGALLAENPAGFAPLVRMRDTATSTYGITSRYSLNANSPDPHNFVSCAIGYWGEHLIAGMQNWSNVLTAVAIDSTATVQQFTTGGWCDRIDVLLSDIASCRLHIYEDNAGVVGSEVFAVDVTEPQNGIVNGSDKYWRSFTLGLTIPTTFWVGLTGSCNAYRYPSNGNISKSGSVVHAGNSFAIRVLEEAGGPFVAGSIISLSVDGEALPYEY